MNAPRVEILVLNWNGYQDTAACLRSLQDQGYENSGVVVVDNGSRDGSGERLAAEFPAAHVHFTRANLGYAGGNNVGFHEALALGADYVLVLNNDTLVEPDCIDHLVRAAREHDAGIVSARIYYDSDRDRFWFAGGRIDPRSGNAINEGLDERDTGQFSEGRSIDFASGCAMLVRRDVIEATGGFDERYFLYFEEVDFCLRAKEAGFRIWFAPEAVVWHKTDQHKGRPVAPYVRYYMTRNRWLFMRRLYSRLPVRIAAGYAGEQARIALALLRRGEWKQLACLGRAHLDALRGRYGARTL